MPGDWVFVAIGVLLLTHLVALGYAIAMARKRAASGKQNSVQGRGAGVVCADCGVDNDPSYRFCRQCVSELPTGVSVVNDSSGGQSRRPL